MRLVWNRTTRGYELPDMDSFYATFQPPSTYAFSLAYRTHILVLRHTVVAAQCAW